MKRALTLEEIENICNIIPLNRGIPIETATSVRNGVISSIRGQLESITIYPDLIPTLYEMVKQEYYMSLLQPGEMIGVQAATSIGEPVSQMTLNAFHYSGISSIGIASGVPRVEEILNASKKQKSYSMTLYPKEHMDIRDLRRKLMHDLIEVYVSNIISSYTVSYISSLDHLSEMDKKWYPLYFALYSDELLKDGELSLHWRMRLELDRGKMHQHSIRCIDVAEKIEDSYRDLYAVASPDNIGIVDIYIDFSQMKLKKKEEEELLPFEHIKDSLCIQNIIIPYILDIQIGGIAGVENIFIRDEKGKWVVDTQGTNLCSVFSFDWLDLSKCISSDIWEIRKILGVEATRQFIINEFYKVLSVSGASVGRRHIELLADSMTFQGKINSVNRYGIDRNETGPLAKASFEESVNNFFIAAVNGESDEMGVSSSVMAGKLAQFGTGYFDLMLDQQLNIKGPILPDPVEEIMKKQRELKNQLELKNQMSSIYKPIIQNPMNPYSINPNMIKPSMINQTMIKPANQFPNYKKPQIAPVYNQAPYIQNNNMVSNVKEHIHPVPYNVPYTLEQKEEKKVVSWMKKKPKTMSIPVAFSYDE